MKSDYNSFPASAYSKAVLKPDLEVYKKHFSDSLHSINLSHGVMLAEKGLLEISSAGSILKALVQIDKERKWKKKNFDGTFEDLFFLIEKELSHKVGEDIAGRLHTGRSRNDMEHTMFRMQLRTRLLKLLNQYNSLAEQFLARAERGINEIVLLYTHGQPAQVSVLGHYLGAVIEFILRDMTRILAALHDVNHCPMGAAAITTSGFKLDRTRVAELLGFHGIVENSYGAIANVDYITASYSAIRLGCIHFGRLIQDLISWTGFEVSQIYVPDGFVQISSIMPQKRNPVPLEHLRLKFSLAAGGAEQIVQTMHNTPFADMNDSERETQTSGFDVFERLSQTLPLLASFVDAMEVNVSSIRSRISKSMASITELADTIVREEKIGFREAHHITSKLARSASLNGNGLDTLSWRSFTNTFEDVIGRKTVMSKELLNIALSPENFVAVRNMPGGPEAKTLEDSLKRYTSQLNSLQAEIKKIERLISSSNARRNATVEEFIAKGK